MGPRLFSRGMRPKRIIAGSISCCFNGAATFQPRNAGLHGTSLREVRLQWGRDFSAAEWLHGGKPRLPRKCFNGAATFQPRNDRRNRQTTYRTTRFNGAATFQPRNEHAGRSTCRVRQASMGPRLFSRGMTRGTGRAPSCGHASMGPRLFSRGMMSQRPLSNQRR